VKKNTQVPLDYKPKPKTPRQAQRRQRRIVSALVLPLAGAAAFVLTQNLTRHAPEAEKAATQVLAVATKTTPELIGSTVDFVVRRNDTLERIFRHLQLRVDDLTAMLQLPSVRRSLNQLRPGDKVTVVHDEGAVQALHRRISDTEVLSVTRSDDGFAAEIITTPIEIKTARAEGTIESSLFVAARAAGVSAENILRLANDIFGWKIDFALDIRPGDRFHLVYEQKYRGGEYIGDGRILAAEFVNDGEAHRAVYFASSDGAIEGYFSPDGHSMRRQFLRAPLDFTRVSSNFHRARRHPILNTIRAHNGVDYAAPTGTPVKAAGDGRVTFAGQNGGYGNVVVLEHGGRITTLYAHLSRFAPSMRNGHRVKQGEIIGYVGSTGAATGPHLHYEYRVNGAHMNPRTVKLPSATPIPATYRAEFVAYTGTLVANLDQTSTAATAPAVPVN
jgi:murein DD-endopeptidase MepM/ murein hydrolase activator NlpD